MRSDGEEALSPPPPRRDRARRPRDEDHDGEPRDDDHRDKRSRRSRHDGDRDEGRDRDRGRDREKNRRRSRSPRRHRRSRSRDRDREKGKGRESGRDRDGGGDKESRRRRSRSRDDEYRRDRRSRRTRDEHDDDDDDGHSVQRGRKARGDGDDSNDPSNKRQVLRRDGPLPSQADSFALTTTGGEPGEKEKEKEKRNLGTTGALAAASNAVARADGSRIVLKYHEPPEARKPPARDEWRLFVFGGGGGELLDTVALGQRSCWLVGREPAVADLVAAHPSISKQHAVLQFRHRERRDEFGDRKESVRPYLIDLESANGTTLNGEKVPPSRYLELRPKDLIQFAQSSREYVLMLAPKD